MLNATGLKLFYITPINVAQLQIYFFVELVLIVVNLFCVSAFIVLIWKILFHVNLKIMGITIFSQYVPMILGRLYVLVRQSGYFYFSNRPEEDVWVILSSWWRSYDLGLILTSHFWVSIERQFAMYFITDYERNSRIWISISICSVAISVCMIAAAIYTFAIFPWYPLVVVGIVFTCVGAVMFFNAYRGALLDMIRKDNGSAHDYTLSLRYQLEENVWCDRLMKNGAITLFFVNTSTFVFFLAANSEWIEEQYGEETSQLLDCLFNLAILVSGPVLLIGAVWYNDDLRAVFRSIFKKNLVKSEEDEKDEGNAYFLHLQQQWDMPKNGPETKKKKLNPVRTRQS